VDVVSAEDMRREVGLRFQGCDCVVMVAAVCDYRPTIRVPGKVKKNAPELLVRMVRNPDILAELGCQKGQRVLVGFALEAPPGREEALRKLREKNLDAIVLNSPQAFGAERSSVEIITADGQSSRLEGAKRDVGRHLIRLVESLAAARRSEKPCTK
jgi:phosphopantothenoylcysteine decarboxylase/phosphopantothenate--cysteine ligase